MESADGSPHCLRRDLRAYYAMQKQFLCSRNQNELEIWEQEQHKLVHLHDEFAEKLVRFLVYPKLTPLQVAQLNDDDPYQPHMDYGAFNNGNDLNSTKYTNDDLSLAMFTHEQCLRTYNALQGIKQLHHPYRGVLGALGVRTDFFAAMAGFMSAKLNPFEEYPYPTPATVLSWPLFSDVHKFEPSKILGLLFQDPLELTRCIRSWREEGGKELVEWWKSDVGSSGHELTDPIVKVKESTLTTEKLSADLRLLLRGDTIFSLQKPGGSGFQGPMLHYPYYYKNPTGCPYPQAPSRMNLTRMYWHLEAERVAKALLRDLDMPDIAYIELLVIEAMFACGRCHDCQPKKWRELWNKLETRRPQFKTKVPITFRNLHDLNSGSTIRPLALRLTKEEAVEANNMNSSNIAWDAECILCCNYKLRPAFKDLLQFRSHMED
ncbi:hypothetical protein FRC08_013639, partial [Ceratobasidium sp. 394]